MSTTQSTRRSVQRIPPPGSRRIGDDAPAKSPHSELDRILGVAVPVSVALAQREMSIEAILAFSAGTIVEFNVPFDSPLTLYIANEPIARGEAVKIGENFGLRITQTDSLEHRIGALGGH